MTETVQASEKEKRKAATRDRNKKARDRKKKALETIARYCGPPEHDDVPSTSGWFFKAKRRKQPVATAPEVVEASTAGDEVVSTVGEAIERIKRGELSFIPRLRQFLLTQPDLWPLHGNIAELAVIAWINVITDVQSPVAHQSLLLKVEEVRKQFSGGSPSPAEQALAESIATCWLRLHILNAMEATSTKSATGPQTMAVILKQQQQAFRQFNEAVMQLETLRRLVPPVQQETAK